MEIGPLRSILKLAFHSKGVYSNILYMKTKSCDLSVSGIYKKNLINTSFVMFRITEL